MIEIKIDDIVYTTEDIGSSVCPNCLGDSITTHTEEDYDIEDYETEEDRNEAYNESSDYECIDCDKQWDCDEIEELIDEAIREHELK